MLHTNNKIKHKFLEELDKMETVFLNHYAIDGKDELELEEVLKEIDALKDKMKKRILANYREIMLAWEI